MLYYIKNYNFIINEIKRKKKYIIFTYFYFIFNNRPKKYIRTPKSFLKIIKKICLK